MGKSAELSKYIAWLRHNFTNYDKYLRIMYDNDDKQTDVRKYINNILYRISMNQLDAEAALAGLRHFIKCAGYQPPPKQKRVKQSVLNKKERRRKNKAKRTQKKNDEGWAKAINKYNKKIEKEEDKIHKQYIQVMLYQIGLSNIQLSKKTLPKPQDMVYN